MKFLYNILVDGKDLTMYTFRGLVIGRPRPESGETTDDLERLGWAGVYDPSVMMDLNQVIPLSGSIQADFDLVPFDSMDLQKIVKAMDVPESTLDDRIKELKNEQKNPAKYRTRWNGVRYVYDRIDEQTPK